MKKLSFYFWLLLSLPLLGCNNAPQSKETAKLDPDVELIYSQATKLFSPLPEKIESPNNKITQEKIALGKALYYDKRLSFNKTQSCNTCHNIETYGVDNKAASKGDNGTMGTRNSPSTFNAALHIAQFWDGRNKNVEEQAGDPILNPVEMGIPDENFIIRRLKTIPEYRTMFAAAYPEERKAFTFENLTKAIGAFERTLITPSKFDHFLASNKEALSEEELKGLKTFIDVGCTTCHSGAALGGNIFMKFGLSTNYWNLTNSSTIDSGKYLETGAEADLFIFKVSSLRNIEKTYPYFHDGSVSELDDAIQIMAKTELNRELSVNEVAEISIFLKTLTGEIPQEALLQ